MKLRTGDNVKVVLGKDKGREGKVEKLYPKENSVLVTGVNLYKKHVKGNQGGVKSGIYDIPRVKIVREKNEINRFCKKCEKKI